MPELSDEDRKLLTLARSALGRSQAATAAALRDGTGRTYVGVDVELPSLRLAALELCVAQAVSSGVTGAEAALLMTGDPAEEPRGVVALADLGGAGVPVIVADRRGEVIRRLTT